MTRKLDRLIQIQFGRFHKFPLNLNVWIWDWDLSINAIWT